MSHCEDRGRGRGSEANGAWQGIRQPYRIPRKKHYFETGATSRSAVLLEPISEDLKWKFAPLRPGPDGKDYTQFYISNPFRFTPGTVLRNKLDIWKPIFCDLILGKVMSHCEDRDEAGGVKQMVLGRAFGNLINTAEEALF